MTLTYDKTNKTLAAAAVASFAVVFLSDLLGSLAYLLADFLDLFLFNLDTLFDRLPDKLPSLINSILDLAVRVLDVAIVVALIRRKKDVLGAICFIVPILANAVIIPVLNYFIIPIVEQRVYALDDMLANLVKWYVFALPELLLYVGIVVSCFTKGKIFSKNAGIVLLLLAILAYSIDVLRIPGDYLINLVRNSIERNRELDVVQTVQNLLRHGYVAAGLRAVATSAPIILISLAFWRPNEELIPEQPAEEVTE